MRRDSPRYGNFPKRRKSRESPWNRASPAFGKLWEHAGKCRVDLQTLCNALSCFIISTILFQFMNGKYKKSSRNRYVYIVIETTTVIFTFCINMLNHSILNLVVWGVLTGIIVYVLYYEDIDKPLRRIIECEALVFCMSVCESLGVILLQCILQAADIKNVNETMLYCLEVTFSK